MPDFNTEQLDDYPGTGPIPGKELVHVRSVITHKDYRATADRLPGAGLSKIPGPNNRPDMNKNLRWWLKADRDAANPQGGDCFEELDYSLCCTGTRLLTQQYRTATNQPMQYDKEFVLIYDINAPNKVHRSGSFFDYPADLVPARFVPIDSPEAQYGYVRRDTNPPSIDDWHVGELSIWDIDGQDGFATSKLPNGPFPAYTGVEDAYWKPAGAPAGPRNSLPTRDLLGAVGDPLNLIANLEAIMALPYDSNGDAPLGSAPVWSKPGLWFDAIDGDGDSWRYTCGRYRYKQGDATSGTGPNWSRFLRLQQ
jgi:hypothetical protein